MTSFCHVQGAASKIEEKLRTRNGFGLSVGPSLLAICVLEGDGRRAFWGQCRRAYKATFSGRKRISFHHLHHRCASWLIQKGVPFSVVSGILGYSTTQSTDQTYSRAGDDAVTEKMGNVFGDLTGDNPPLTAPGRTVSPRSEVELPKLPSWYRNGIIFRHFSASHYRSPGTRRTRPSAARNGDYGCGEAILMV